MLDHGIGKQPSISLIRGVEGYFFYKKERGRMKEREVLFGLHETRGIGWATINHVRSLVGDLTVLCAMTEKEVCALPFPPNRRGVPFPESRRRLIWQGSRPGFIADQLLKLEKFGFQFVTIVDEEYPHYLYHTFGAPWVFYYAGNYELLKLPVVAIVGTRVPTAYGKRVARTLAYELSQAGWHVASGMARGIDSEAHIGALQGPGSTIAVLGSPVNIPYPKENTPLYERIRAEGLVISEYPIGTPIKNGMFPERNRIISGVSLGTVVVEADMGSGSLITANFALAQGREIFAVPGPISSPKSAGALDLIKHSGAHLLMSVHDIFKELHEAYPQYCPMPALPQAAEQSRFLLTADEQKTLSHISDIPITFDHLYEATQFDFGHLHSVLISLLVKKRIEQQPGSSYILSY